LVYSILDFAIKIFEFNPFCCFFCFTDDDQCDTFSIASILAGITTHIITGPFKNSETYSMMCQ
jgi:hypothetical protein